MKHIFVVRHALSEANAAGIIAGSGFETPLHKDGAAQAKKAGKDLKQANIELIVCSPMLRTRQTAEFIAQQINYDKNKIILNDYFVERGFGPYEGTPFQQYVADSESGKLKDGVETTEQLYERVALGMDWLKTQNAQKILVVTHGATGKMIKLIEQKLEHSHFHTIERLGNAELFEFTL
jgi:uncharacterized phosphatase